MGRSDAIGFRDRRQAALLPADAAGERSPVRLGPAAQLGQLIVVDEKLSGADGTENRLLAVAAGLAPLQHGPVGEMLLPANVVNDGANRRAERGFGHPGSKSIMTCLRTDSPRE